MKHKPWSVGSPSARIALLCAGLAVPLAPAAWGQSASPAPAASSVDEEVVVLPQFEVRENTANPYQSPQALSASRVAMDIQDVPQTISVVSRELIEDSLGARMLDVAKYVTPIAESTLPFGGDRYMVRGFQVSQEFIDGSTSSGADGYSMSIAPYNIERIEVLKGPNAILVPGGSPGGVMNPITKSPFGRNQVSITLGLAQYNGNEIAIDINRVLTSDGKYAARLVAGFYRNDLYIKDQYRNGFEIAPSLAIQLSKDHKLTIKADFVQNRETNLGGVPLDPSVGTANGVTAQIARGLPRDWSFGNDEDSRHRASERLSAELLSTLSEHITSRLYASVNRVSRVDVGGTGAALAGAGGGSRNPSTGLYEPGVNWTLVTNADGTVTPVSAVVPVTDPSTWSFPRNNSRVDLVYEEAHLKNDYAAVFGGRTVKSTTIAGYAANFSKVHFVSNAAAARPTVYNNDLAAITFPHYAWATPTPAIMDSPTHVVTAGSGGDKTVKKSDLQFFLLETLSFFEDRVQVSAGLSRFYGTLERTDGQLTSIPSNTTIGVTRPSFDLTDTAKTFGLVIKPIKEVSLFAGYNTTGGSMPSELNAGNYAADFRATSGDQKEAGVKTSLLDGRLTASFSYFKIAQQNYSVPNSEFYRLQSEGASQEVLSALQNPLFLDLNSKGWEAEFSYSLGKNLTILGNYTDYKARQPITEVTIRGVPDRIGGIYLDYRFTGGFLDGFGFNVGVDYKSKVAGENATGYTTSRPITGGVGFVANQPSFYVPGRTLTNLGLSYRAKAWTVRLTITNLLDEDYIMAAGSRTSVVIGEPRAWKLSTTYKY